MKKLTVIFVSLMLAIIGLVAATPANASTRDSISCTTRSYGSNGAILICKTTGDISGWYTTHGTQLSISCADNTWGDYYGTWTPNGRRGATQVLGPKYCRTGVAYRGSIAGWS